MSLNFYNILYSYSIKNIIKNIMTLYIFYNIFYSRDKLRILFYYLFIVVYDLFIWSTYNIFRRISFKIHFFKVFLGEYCQNNSSIRMLKDLI